MATPNMKHDTKRSAAIVSLLVILLGMGAVIIILSAKNTSYLSQINQQKVEASASTQQAQVAVVTAQASEIKKNYSQLASAVCNTTSPESPVTDSRCVQASIVLNQSPATVGGTQEPMVVTAVVIQPPVTETQTVNGTPILITDTPDPKTIVSTIAGPTVENTVPGPTVFSTLPGVESTTTYTMTATVKGEPVTVEYTVTQTATEVRVSPSTVTQTVQGEPVTVTVPTTIVSTVNGTPTTITSSATVTETKTNTSTVALSTTVVPTTVTIVGPTSTQVVTSMVTVTVTSSTVETKTATETVTATVTTGPRGEPCPPVRGCNPARSVSALGG